MRGRFGPVCQRRPTVETSSPPASFTPSHWRKFHFQGPVRPGLSKTTYCRNPSNSTFSRPNTFITTAPPFSDKIPTSPCPPHSLIGGNFIFRGQFGPVCQGRPIVETSSLLLLVYSILNAGGFQFKGPVWPGLSETTYCRNLSHSTFSMPTIFITTAPPFSDKDFILTGTRTHSSLLASLMP